MGSIVFRTDNEFGYSVKFSPHDLSVVALAAGTNFGMFGSGSLWVLKMIDGKMVPISRRNFPDVMTDVEWSPWNPEILAAVSGDGSLSMLKLNVDKREMNIVMKASAHRSDISSVVWTCWDGAQSCILTSSWDGTVKKWNPERANSAIVTLPFRRGIRANDLTYSPFNVGLVISSSSDGFVNLWDLRIRPGYSCVPQLMLNHGCDTLTNDISKFDSNLVVSGGVDGTIIIWDLRSHHLPVCVLRGHSHPVRRVSTCPFSQTSVWSASYDFSVRKWDISSRTCEETNFHHTEFVTGLSVSKHHPGLWADCSWDQTVRIKKQKNN